ncbi:MAG: hypothetical protein H6708_13110 [Kofleriaceae bacterium]|nr:hypothetical protein [Kofleriaceae bacterium]
MVATSAAAGCTIYTGDDDDCNYDWGGVAQGIRNPDTNQCEYWGGGGGGCDDTPVYEPQAYPDWAYCDTACEQLDEQGCLVTSGCRATYVTQYCPPNADCAFMQEFSGCVGTAPSGPVQGACEGLDAHECSRHDDCIAVYMADPTGEDLYNPTFSYCAPEPWSEVCYSNADCPAGYECSAEVDCLPPPCPPGEACPDVCAGRCVPSTWGCEATDCGPGFHCELQCYPCDPADPNDPVCDPYCEPYCVPDQPSECSNTVCPDGSHCEETCYSECYPDGTCTGWCGAECVPDTMNPGECDGAVYCDSLPPQCPGGTVPGVLNGCWTGFCIPEADCGPRDPGECGGPVACGVPPPSCPAGTEPGVANGCWTGYCIPDWACGSTQTCEAVGSEAECASRADCTPVYEGYGCTCYPDGSCQCDEWNYARCETGGIMPPPEPQPL